MEKLYTVRKKQDQELTGSDHELLIAKYRLKLKKVGKTTRLFRYDLNQIPYNYTVVVTNRFKGLDLIDLIRHFSSRMPEELRTEVCDTVKEAAIKTISKKKKCRKAKWLSEKVKLLSRVRLCDSMNCSLPCSSMGFSRQKYWSGLPFPSPKNHLVRRPYK